jgi:hypothetical protein
MRTASHITKIAFAAFAACKSHHEDPSSGHRGAGPQPATADPAPQQPTSGTVPKATAPITIDGDWHDPDWNNHKLLFKFRGLSGDDSDEARPYSEVRFIHDDNNLYVGLYASDNNIQSTDAFELKIGPLEIQITAAGKVTPDSPDIKVGVDRDGTLDDPSNHDEEWKLEISIPLARTGLAPGKTVDGHAARCDTPLGGTKRCGEWTGQLTLE